MFSTNWRKLVPIVLLVFLCSCSKTPADIPTESTTAAVITTAVEQTTSTEQPSDTPAIPTETAADEYQITVDSMTLDEKIYSLFIVTPEQLLGSDKPVNAEDYVTAPTPELLTALDSKPVAGVVMFGGNIINPEQIKSLNEVFSSRDMFVCIDEEGGDIVRIAGNPEFDVPWFLPAAECDDPYTMYMEISIYLRQYGFNLNFAPVADISVDGGGVIGNRAFGSDPQTVCSKLEDSLEVFRNFGVISCIKHFPGHGAASADSHFGAALVDKSLDELTKYEFLPFVAGIKEGAPFVMVGHITVPEVTGDLPSTLSPEMMSVLRNDLGFEGVIITDSFWMEAITNEFGSGEASLMALEAGADIVLMPDDLDEAYKAVRAAIESGELTEEEIDAKITRILKVKNEYGI